MMFIYILVTGLQTPYYLVLVVLLSCAVSHAAADEAEQHESRPYSRSIPQTRLRAASPDGEFETLKGATRLRRVRVTVKNVGEATAQDIKVRIITPNGTQFEGSGPDRLLAKTDGFYTCYPGEYVMSTKKIKVEVQCSNCHP